jgi:hypothetical protein
MNSFFTQYFSNIKSMMKKTTVIQIIFLIVLSFIACQKEDNAIQGLDGTWIELDTHTDTIVFKTNFSSGSLMLNRGFETINGYYLPKIGSGPYAYEISNDSINLTWLLSSSVYPNRRNYFFNLNESSGTFNVQVFTAFETNKAILTFKKLE